MRGRLASRPIDEVLREAERLVAAGVKELLVISQDTSAYGADLRYQPAMWRDTTYETRFIDLARGLGSLGAWVRLHYVYPYPHVDAVIALMAEGRVLPYLDVPFQHGSPSVLKRMRRPAHAVDTLARIQAWRGQCPELVIRSTFIVGFPGETEREFKELLDWMEEAQLDRVGCFKYSPVAGAAANALPDHVPAALQEERYARFMERAGAISAARLKRRVGSRMRVLVDAIDGGTAIARSAADAPEIDGVVRIASARSLVVGDWADVKIVSADAYDLSGRLLQ
jgi:ribosomal protein S12 methylthiotransferase